MPETISEEATATAVTQEAIDAVCSALEQVFAGNIEYDEAFERLQIYPSKVRRNWPNLYQATRNPPNIDRPALLAVLDDASLHDLETQADRVMNRQFAAALPLIVKGVIEAMPKPQIIQQVAPQPPSADGSQQQLPQADPDPDSNVNGMQVYDYQTWLSTRADTSRIGQKWAIRWDNPAPMPSLGQPMTARIPNGGRRIRWRPNGYLEERVQEWEVVSFPPEGN